jgi:LacI family transcriptional regulator
MDEAESRPRMAPNKRPVTIREVADAAGVSLMTVSNVLNGRVGTSTPETSARVQREVQRLGYRRQAAARGLRLAAHEAIGMIIIDESPNFLADPFITQLVAGLSNEVNRQGYAILLHGMAAGHLSESPMVRNLRTDALCVLLSGSPRTRNLCLNTLVSLNQPLVVFQETLPTVGPDMCYIRQDDFAGGGMLGDAVIRRGARHLMLLLPELYWPAIGERARGVKAAIRRSGVSVTSHIVRAPDGNLHEMQAALRAAVARHGRPDAVLAGNDLMAIAATNYLRGEGLSVPRDVMVTGFNGFDAWQHTEPMLTTVLSCAYQLGARGGSEILARIRGKPFPAAEIVMPVSFLPGASI